MTTQMIVQLSLLLIPILVPLILRGVKALVPKIPTWVVPIAAPIIGAVAAGLTAAATGTDPGLVTALGAGGGLAGVGLREVVDQTTKRVTEGPKLGAGEQ